MEGLNGNPFTITDSETSVEDSICHHRWLVNGDEVKLIQKADKLFHEVINKEEGVYLRGELPFPQSMSIGSVISIVSRQQVYMPERETVGFCQPLHRFDVGNLELTLLKDKDGPIWQLLDKATQKTEWNSFSATYASENCHRETFGLFEDVKDKIKENNSNRMIRSFTEDFEVKGVVRVSEIEPARIVKISFSGRKFSFMFSNEARKASKKNDLKLKLQKKIIKTDGPASEDPKETISLIKREILKSRRPMYKIKERLKKEDVSKEFLGLFYIPEILDKLPESETMNIVKCSPRYKFISDQASNQTETPLKVSEELSEKVDNFVHSIMPFYVIVEPKTVPSIIDPLVRVSKLRWSACIIYTDGCCGEHTELIIEGIKDGFFPVSKKFPKKIGEHFMYLLHLQGPNAIECKSLNPERFHYIERTQVFLFESKKVKEMINSSILESKEPIKFSVFGCDSIFSGRAHNCFTWARDKLRKMGLEIGWVALGFIATEPKSFTHTKEYHEKKTVLQKI